MEKITKGVGLGRINLLNYATTDEFIPSFLGLDSNVTLGWLLMEVLFRETWELGQESLSGSMLMFSS